MIQSARRGLGLGLTTPTRIKPAFYENTGFMRSVPWWTRSLRSLGPACARQHSLAL